MINFYSFSVDKEEIDSHQPQSAQGFFYLSKNEDGTPVAKSWNKSPKTILLVSNTLEHSAKSGTLFCRLI